MYKLLRMALLTLPLGGGMAWAQGSATGGTAGAPAGVNPEGGAGTTDTRTPTQKRAGQTDTLPPAVPGDATTKPMGVPPTAPESDRAGLPDSASKPDTATKPDTTTKSDTATKPGSTKSDTKTKPESMKSDTATEPDRFPSRKSPKSNSDEPHHGDISKDVTNSDK
jgi:hypothetical protein